jgi:thiol:disulfide interchange protein DsbD
MRLILALVLASTPLLALAEDEHVQVALLSEQDALVPGTMAWLGLRLTHAPHWHTYWVNPGDSGLPTKLTWQLPAGFRAGEIAWPAPRRIDVGELQNFGYEGDIVLPVPVDVPATAPGSTAHLAVTAKWLVCHEECIPGKAQLALDLPVRMAARTDPRHAALFAAARAAQPQNGAWQAQARLVGESVEVSLRGADLGDARGIDAFAETSKVVANTAPVVKNRNAAAVLTFAKSEYFTALPDALDLVVVRPSARALRVRAVFENPSSP